jgi:hypothetical protein
MTDSRSAQVRTVLNEGTVKRNVNTAPSGPRPAPPKAQVVAPQPKPSAPAAPAAPSTGRKASG